MLASTVSRFVRRSAAVTIMTALAAALSACSSGSAEGRDIWMPSAGSGSGGSATNLSGGAHDGAAGKANAGASGGPGASSGGSQGSGGSTGLILGGNPGSGEDSGAEKACEAETRAGQRVPLDMYFLVDSSGSMAEDVQGGTKWEVVTRALVDFLQDPRNSELGAGIGYFPNSVPTDCSSNPSDCFCIPFINLCFVLSGGSCSVADYAEPAVPLAVPASTADIISNLRAREVAGGTPTRAALEGALQYLEQWAELHPERKPVLVLATDGDPTGCDGNIPETIADLAATALAGPQKIKTFVIGVGSSLIRLNLVAQAGGTDGAFLVDTGGDVATAFSEALDEIRGAAASCDFTIPSESSSAEKVDPKKVNVRLTPKGASSARLVAQTFESDPENCGSEGGWYYDDPAEPTLIRLCESTCQSLSGGSIDVEFGCDTQVQPPR